LSARSEEGVAGELAVPADMTTRATMRVLGDRTFGPYFAGNFVSNCGSWLQLIALNILVYRLTDSTFLLGVVNFAQFAGVFVLAPWAGSAADRFDRRRLLLTAQSGTAAVTLVLAVVSGLGLATTPMVVALALLLGVTNAFQAPAMHSLLPSLVSRDRLHAAIALNSVAFNLGRAVGPALAAVVIAKLSVTWAFGIASVLYLGLVVALLFIHPVLQAPVRGARPRLRDSIAVIRARPRLALLLAIVAASAVSVDPITTLGPAFATDAFGKPDTLAGYFMGAFGAGSVTAAFFVGGRPGRTLLRVAATLLLLAAGIAAFAVSPTFAVAVAVLYVTGFGYLSSNTAATTRLQLAIGDHERGRVMALWTMAFIGIRPIGSLVDGALASTIGIHAAAMLMTLPALGVAVAILVTLRRDARTAAESRTSAAA
jgi:MFS family permease